MASMKRTNSEVEDLVTAKKIKVIVQSKAELPRVVLNPADCDLDFNIEENGLQGHALYELGFAYCWSGARANVGITGGKYCFGCKIIAAQPVDMNDTPPDQQHLCRFGLSKGDDILGKLGETSHSYGFGGTGKFSNAGQFSSYGDKFGVGDTVVCAVNLENRSSAAVGFSKNRKFLGIAKLFDSGTSGLELVDSSVRNLRWDSAFFPHVLLKNVVVQLQFSIDDGLVPEAGYKPWASALEDGNAIMGPTFCNTNDCEVLVMVGLPASGKTTWAEKWIEDHPEKRYVLLGTNLALDQMKVPGLLRKQNYGERFECLMERATGIFNTLLSRAVKIRRNYIIDQTNVYRNARNRKTRPFANFRKIAVVVFPSPRDLKLRSEKRVKEMGKEVPSEAVKEMIDNYVLPLSKDMPGSNECFDQVLFPELNREEAQKYLNEMKRESKKTSNLSSNEDYSRSCSSYLAANNAAPSVTSMIHQSTHSPSTSLNYDYQRHVQGNGLYEDYGRNYLAPQVMDPYFSRERFKTLLPHQHPGAPTSPLPALPLPNQTLYGSSYNVQSSGSRSHLSAAPLDPRPVNTPRVPQPIGPYVSRERFETPFSMLPSGSSYGGAYPRRPSYS